MNVQKQHTLQLISSSLNPSRNQDCELHRKKLYDFINDKAEEAKIIDCSTFFH